MPLVLNQRRTRFALLGLSVVAGAVVVGFATGLLPALWDASQKLWASPKAPVDSPALVAKPDAAQLIRDDRGDYGLRLAPQAVEALQIKPVPVRPALTPRALPPQIGTLNYDNDRLFSIRPRFQGELAWVKDDVPDVSGAPSTAKKFRPLRFGDRVKQGELLAVIWSRELGEKKAALVDALSAQRLSKNMLERQEDLYTKGATSLSAYLTAERQLQADTNAVLTAERTLKMWKLADDEIKAIKDEAKIILDTKKVRSAELEKQWARVEVRVPKFCDDPNRELVVVEKNTHLNDMVDPSKDIPLFRVADLSRLQIWVHPPEEYLPLLRERLRKRDAGPLTWQIRFQSDLADTPPQELEIVQIAPSLEPYQHTPMVMGYLTNTDNKYLIGQFVTATIFMSPEPDTAEIPTEALNEVEGQALVFVETNAAKGEYMLRRVAVVRRFKDVTFVRTKLTADEEKVSREEVRQGRRPLRPLRPGERVITRGVVEMTQALDNRLSSAQAEGKAD